MLSRYHHWFALAIVVAASFLVWMNFPNPGDYRVGADEGTYYRQGKTIADLGPIAGLRRVGDEYVQTPAQRSFPNPLRIGTILVAGAALSIHDSYRTLSFVSLFAFALMLLSLWRYSADAWGEGRGLMVLAVAASFPLALGMATRALMDSLACTAAAFSLFAFLRFLKDGSDKAAYTFVAAFAAAILVKETNVLLAPFFAGVLFVLKLNGSPRLGWRRALLVAVLPGAIAVICYVIVFGFDEMLSIARAVAAQSTSQNEYMQAFAQGPWYRYLLDFLVLSPWSFLLAVCGAGFVLIGRGDRPLLVWLGLCAYLLFVYGWLDKDARFLMLLVPPISLLAAAAVSQISRVGLSFKESNDDPGTRYPSRDAGASAAVLCLSVLVVVTNLVAYRRFFVVGEIYDPMTYNLLRIDRSIPAFTPTPAVATVHSTTSLEAAKQRWLQQPTAENVRQLSYEYCAAGAYLECRWASQEALKIAPDDASAYNNLCTAFGGLKQWTQAVIACREALRLKPDFQLARNNLDWVQSEEAKK